VGQILPKILAAAGNNYCNSMIAMYRISKLTVKAKWDMLIFIADIRESCK